MNGEKRRKQKWYSGAGQRKRKPLWNQEEQHEIKNFKNESQETVVVVDIVGFLTSINFLLSFFT